MKYDLFELINISIQTNIPITILEGKDDVQIYSRIAQKAKKKIEFWLINDIEDYYSGCNNVIKCIQKIQQKFDEREEIAKLIVGIIDKDVRDYRPLMPYEIDYNILKGLFVLKYYSIETYFATAQNLKKLLSKLTYVSEDEITSDIIEYIESNYFLILSELYYISLEALKNACHEDYNAIIGYQTGEVKDDSQRKYIYSLIQPKTNELDEFANNINLTIKQIKQICKGKWLLYTYIYKAVHQIKSLSELCMTNETSQCKSCKIGNFTDCRYKFKTGYQIENLYNDIFEYIDEEECSDIITIFRNLN